MKIIQSIKEKINNSMEALEERYIDANNVVSVGKSELDTIVVEGKTSQNFFPIDELPSTITSKGVTFSVSKDGKCSFVGTAASGIQNRFHQIYNLKNFKPAEGTYTLSIPKAAGVHAEFCSITLSYTLDGRSAGFYNLHAGESITSEIPITAHNFQLVLQTDEKQSGDINITLCPMLAKSPKPQPWTPTGLTCVESAEIEMAGKNLAKPVPEVPTQSRVYDGCPLNGEFTFSMSLKDFKFKQDNAIFHTFNSKGQEGFVFPNQFGLTQEQSKTGVVSAKVQFKDVKRIILETWANFYPEAKIKWLQLEAGSTATPYEHYHLDTLPINLQSNKLCSLPNGVHDELRVTREGDRGHVELVKRTVEVTASSSNIWASDSKTPEGAYRYFTKLTDEAVSYIVGNQFTYPLQEGTYAHANINSCNFSGNTFWVFMPQPTVKEMIAAIPESGYTAIAPAAAPHTIDLGYIDLPELSAPNATVWTSSNLPNVNTNVTYTKPPVYSVDTVIKHYLHSLKTQPMIAKGSKAPQDPQKFPVWIDTNNK